jgi:hypothetical protein
MLLCPLPEGEFWALSFPGLPHGPKVSTTHPLFVYRSHMRILLILRNRLHHFASPNQGMFGNLWSFSDQVLLSVPYCRSDRDASPRQQHPGLGLSLSCVDRHHCSGPHEVSSSHEICQCRWIFLRRGQLNSPCRSSFCRADDRGTSTNHLAMAKSIFVYNSLFQRRAIVMPWCFMTTSSLLESISPIPDLRPTPSASRIQREAKAAQGARDPHLSEGLMWSLGVRLSSPLQVVTNAEDHWDILTIFPELP